MLPESIAAEKIPYLMPKVVEHAVFMRSAG
jgi:hypothetical protein